MFSTKANGAVTSLDGIGPAVALKAETCRLGYGWKKRRAPRASDTAKLLALVGDHCVEREWGCLALTLTLTLTLTKTTESGVLCVRVQSKELTKTTNPNQEVQCY